MSQWLVATEYLDEEHQMDHDHDHGVDEQSNKEELKQWLIDDVGLGMYYSAFLKNGFHSLRFIRDIQSEQELEEMGIVLKGHKRRIMTEIQKLRPSKKSVVQEVERSVDK